MTPMFDPGANPYGDPAIFLAAVGRRMTEVAGEVADGLLVHAFTTERYLREITVPALERGAAKVGKTRHELQSPIRVSSSPARRAGDGERCGPGPRADRLLHVHPCLPSGAGVARLGRAAERSAHADRRGEWDAMGALIDDEVLNTFAVVAALKDVPNKILDRYGTVVDRFGFYAPYPMDDDQWQEVLSGFSTTLTRRGTRTTGAPGRPSG